MINNLRQIKTRKKIKIMSTKPLEIVIASNNPHKIKEYEEMFSSYSIKVLSPKELGIDIDPNESGTTFKENSLIKALAFAKCTNKCVLADDSGLSVDALDGFPGIYSARFAKEEGGNKEANLKIIEMLKDKNNRNASFNCVITLVNLNKNPLVFIGKCQGKILEKIEGEEGFGYDPIFYSNEAKTSFGLASEEIKNTYSHRALALKQLLNYLKENKFID